MHDLLTPDDLAEINDAAHNLRAEKFFHDADRVFALLRHIAALEARTPAPALPADMETLLADAGYKAVLAALRQEAVDKCAGGFGAPDLDADYQLSLSLLVREVYQILNIEQHIDALATALRETLARAEKAEAERDAALKRMDIAERERDTAVARLHAAEDLVVKNAIERDAYKQSADGAGVVICRIKAERDAARKELARLGPVEREQASPNIDMWWPERVTDLECRTNRRRAIRRVLEGGAA